MRVLLISFACAALLMGFAPAGAAPVSRIAAVVNGDMITVRELDKQVQNVIRHMNSRKQGYDVRTVRAGVLDSMINEKLVVQQAAKEKIEVKDDEIDAFVEHMIKESNLDRDAFMKQIASEGLNMKSFREQARLHLLSQRLLARNVTGKVVVTEKEINEYYRRNMAGMASGRARVALLIYPADADADKWARDIASGKISFADAARRVSVGPNPAGGGDMGFVETSDMAPGLLQQISGMKKGQVSPVLNMGVSRAQVCLLDVEEGNAADMKDAKPDPATAKQIEQILREPRLKERFEQYRKELRNKALIDIRN